MLDPNQTDKKACTSSKDYFDSVVALDLTTGAVKWATRALAYDAWNVACIFVSEGVGNCPKPEGPDFDFGGNGPNLFSVSAAAMSGKHDSRGHGDDGNGRGDDDDDRDDGKGR